MNEADEILTRLEGRGASFRGAFCLALIGLATLVVANVKRGVPDVIRTKSMQVMSGDKIAASIGAVNHKVVFGTYNGSNSLVSVGEGSTGAGVIVLSAANGKSVLRVSTTKGGGGSLGLNDSNELEIANASPNITNAGSLFIDNAAGTLIGEINGDKSNGGAIITHNAAGTETGRVHQ